MKSADDKAVRFGYEAREAAIKAWRDEAMESPPSDFEPEDGDTDLDYRVLHVAEIDEAVFMMRSRPATAPGDWVAVMAEAESLLWANSDWGRDWWWRDVKALGEKCRDMAKAEPAPECPETNEGECNHGSPLGHCQEPAPKAKASAAPTVCCGQPASCIRPCVHRGRYQRDGEIADLKEQLAEAKADTDTQRTLTQVAHDERDEWVHSSRDWKVRAEKAEQQLAAAQRAEAKWHNLHSDLVSEKGRILCRLGDMIAQRDRAIKASGDAKLRELREKVCGWAGGSTDPRSADPSDIDAAQLVREIDHLLADHYPELLIEEN
jgi:hypothetical protein